MHPLLTVDLTGIGTLILAAATACLALLTWSEVQNSDENIRIARGALLALRKGRRRDAPDVAGQRAGRQREPDRVRNLPPGAVNQFVLGDESV